MSESNPSPNTGQKESHLDIQHLLDYISNLSNLMADADRDAVYKFLTTKNNLDFLRTFCSRENIHNISLVINEDDNPNQGEEYLLESDPSLKSFPSTNIIFIKKIPYLDCSDIKKIKKDLQILNFSTESNDTTMLSHIQNCIQSTFLSLFNSYKELIKIEKTSAIKTYNVNQLQNKVTELVDSINKTWKTSNIPVVKLEFEKFYLAIKEKLKKEKGREPTADDFLSVLDDTQLNSLYDCLNKWQAEISQVIKMDRNLSDGNTLDEIEFWVDYIKVIKSIRKQLESSDVQITLDIAIKKGKTFITNPFQLNTKTDEYIKRADSYNILLKDLPIKEMYNSNNIDDLIIQIQKIFEVVKNKMRLSDYPLKRVQQLIDCVNEDMISQLIKIIGPNLMSMKYDDFHELMKKCSNLFEKIWKSEFEQLKKDIQELGKKKNEDLLPAKASFPHNSLQGRLSDINSFRLENKELVEITLKLNKSNTNSEKKEESQITRELKNAYKLSYNIDVLDLSDNGVNAWANVKSEYNKVVEKIEGQISSSLSEQLASAQNIIEKFRIFEKFKIIIKRPRIQASIQDYQRALIRNVSEDLNILKEKFNSGYENSSAAKLCSIRGIPPISGEIIWNNQFLAQAESYKNKIASVLGDTWESTEEGKKLKTLIQSFSTITALKNEKIDTWEKNNFNANKKGTNVNDIEKIIYIDGNYGNYKLKVNFNNSLIDFKECRLMKRMKDIKNMVQKNFAACKDYYPFALAIQDAFRTFNNCCQKIKNEPKINKLIAKEKGEIQQYIKDNTELSWSNEQKVITFAKVLCEKVSSFEEKVTELISMINQIDSLLQQILKVPIQKDSISENVSSIQSVINQITGSNKEYSNVEKWIKDIDTKLENNLMKRLEECLEIWKNEFLASKPLSDPILIKEVIVHKISMENKSIILQPSIFDAREYWYNQLHQTINIILNNRRLYSTFSKNNEQNLYKETTYRDLIPKIDSKILLGVYSALEKTFLSCEEYVKTWSSYQVLWQIEPQFIFTKLGDDMEKWQQIMEGLKQGRKTFDNDKNEKVFGALVVDYSSVQDKVNNKYDFWHKEIMNQFAQKSNEGMIEFSKKISAAKDILEKNSLETESGDIVAFITEISKVNKNLSKWQIEMDKYKKAHTILQKQKFSFPQKFKKLDELNKEWNNFLNILKEKSNIMKEKEPGAKARISAEESSINQRIAELEKYWSEKKPDKAENPAEALEVLSEAKKLIEEVNDDYVKNCKAKELLEMDYSDPNKLNNLYEEIKDLEDVWTELNKIFSKIDEKKDTPFVAINADKIKKALEEALTKIDELPDRYHSYDAFEITKNKLKYYKKVNTIIGDLGTEAIKERHWKNILKILNIDKVEKDLILNDLWKADLQKKEKLLQEIINQAAGELVLENYIKKSKARWNDKELDMIQYKQKCKLIKGWDDMFSLLDEDINSFQSMSNSPYYNLFKDEIEPWKDKLENIRLLLNEWVDVQRKWVYLEGIFFGSADIKNELPGDYNKFQSIDNEFTSLMKRVTSKPYILEVITIPNIKSILEEKLKTALERIQKALYNFLEKQRQNFARFYFIGDEDLLEIIGNSKDVNKITRHFNKMFAGMNSLICTDGDELKGMISREFEEVLFEKSVKISEDPVVYQWLRKVQEQMHFTLATKLEKAVSEISEMDYIGKVDEFIKWIEQYPAQITVLSSQVLWSASIEAALTGNKTLKALPDGFSLESEEQVINNMLSALSDQVLKDIKVDMRKKLEQLITELVHQRDVVRLLKSKKITNVEAFEWLYYMRFYFYPKTPDVLKRLQIKMSNASFDYGFEYLGVAEKLIQTPLTDRCYLTLTQGLYFRLGGAPFGPAGTGKTESVKALGGQLGRFVLVFNCDENFDFKAMGRIFVGLCQVGAWGCFDEFNRLEERILSAVSQQILIIQLGLRELATNIDLMGKNIKLNHQMGIFVTMNPGYAGRSQLPDNLKQLFRQMAMVKPDKDMIAQVTLYSQGYKTAERLSSKMVSLFELCSSQLSSQSHYDFGLRALKSVLVNAGNLKRKEDKERETTKKDSGLPIEQLEQNILLRSVCNTLIPKLVSEDITLFNSLLSGVFPDCKIEEVREDALKNKIIELCQLRNLNPENKFIDKILQLYSIQKMHHGVMMVGQSGTGKSAAWKILLEALTALDGIKGESYIIDPKAVNKENLYGKLDQTTLDWTDGVFTGTLRKILDNQRGESGKRHWIIFDGDVDPEWAENLNSVLDDNKLLTLPHGDRLQIPPNVRIMFEVESLKYATLATVSRCGMVWFSEDIVTIDMMFSHYLKRLKQNNFDDSMNYLANQSGALLEFDNSKNDYNIQVRTKASDSIKMFFEPNNLVQRALEASESMPHVMEFSRIRVIESMFALLRKGTTNIIEYNDNHSEFPMNDDQIFSYMSKWLIVSIIWGLGGSLSLGNRTKFSEKLREFTSDIEFPNDPNFQMIDYYVNIGENRWNPWKARVPNTDIESEKVSDADVVIPTVDTVRHQEILKSWISEHRPFILCGPPGSGKTMTLMATLKILTDFEMVFINFSSSTTPDLILKTFDHYCEYIKSSNGTILRPKLSNKYLVIFCDEINLPEMDKYSTQVVITFLREITEQNGFWRPLDKTWIKLERIQFVGACNPPTDVGRHPLNNRFLRHCPLLYVDFPGKDSLRQIYGTFNRAILRKAGSAFSGQSEPLTEAMVEFYTQCQTHYTPDIQPHYIYSPRELTRWKHAINESIENISDPDGLVRLWAHEALRLFQDRLVLDEEKVWCDQLVDKVASQCFPSLSPQALERPILFTNLLTDNYVSCGKDELIKKIEAKLQVFYEEELNVPLVIFDSVLEHILRIDRVLKQPIGHLLLVGQSGVGKTTLSRFVAWMNDLTVFQIKAGRNYGVADFDADLRGIMKRAGCKGEKICFIFDESNVLGPAFLERMNALLASGEVPGLFEGDEYISLLNMAREHIVKEIKGVDTEEEIYKAFIKGVQRNLHVVFTMNPLSPDFSNRAASSPALYNRCVIDWFGDWSREGLFQVAKKLTENADLRKENFKKQDMSKEEMHTLIVDSITSYHMIIKDLNDKLAKNAKKFNYITPRDFLDFIKHFINLQKEKNDELNEQKSHIDKGLQKIIQTEKTVNELKQSLAIKGKELDKKQEEMKIKFDKIRADTEKGNKSKEKAEIKKKQIEETKKKIDERTNKVNEKLSTVVPKMEAAKQAIGNMSKKNIATLKSLKVVKNTLKLPLRLIAMIYIFLTKKIIKEKLDWDEIKNCIFKEDFISTIKNTKAENLGPKLTNLIQKEISATDWDIDKIKSGFLEVGLLAEWLESTVACANINNQMEPLKKEIADLNAKKDKVVADYDEIAKEIETLEKNIEQLKTQYDDSVTESNKIKEEITQVQNKVERSEKLLINLSSEKERWSKQMNEFKININNLLGDTFLSSSFLAYIGFYDAFYRKYLKEKARQISKQNEIISSNDFDEVEWLTKANDKAIWQNCKLPNDNICLENATILQRFNRYPLIIDPAGQATEFIKTYYATKKLTSTTFTDSSFLKLLENALRFGYPILVQDVEKIDPIMNSLLNKEIHKQSGRNLIRIGDQEIDFSLTFNMFMITRDSSCHFTPDLCSRVTFLNFTITPSSLQNQILDIVLKNERPEVNQRKEELIKAQREYKVQLRQLEEDLLTALNSEGNLLENNEVMTRLEEIKKKSFEISEEVSKSEDIMKELESNMNEYAPLANKASRIFFALDSLEVIHYLYRYSLSFFMDILNYVIISKEVQEVPKNQYAIRQAKIIQILFKEIYHRVGYSLLNKDKALLAMRLAQINLGDKFKNEINLLLKINSNIMNDASDISSDILGGKLTLNQKKQLSELNKSEPFTGLVSEITSNSEAWSNFYNDAFAENSIPVEFLNKHKENISNEKDQKIFDEITKSILLLVFRPDRMLNSIQSFLKEVFNEELVNIPELDLVKVIKDETNCKMPILFCSAPGFDASTKIESLARQLNKKFLSIAIGSSEGFELVEKNWASKIKSGEWLVLKNVHLAPNWLNEIEKRLYANEPNPNFRLFLTMEFNPKIPANVLRISRKFVFELPSGIKHSLIRSYANVLTPAKSEKTPHERCRLHFLLAWFLAVIGERLRYVPIGWSKYYEFNESDQRCALEAIDEWINIYSKDRTNIPPKQIPWDAIRTIIHQSMYGGKIDNEYDMKILESLVNLYFNEKAYSFNYPLFKTSSENQDNVLKVPGGTTNAGFIEWINSIPNVESPEWSGLPNNAEKLVRETASNRFITEMNKIQGIEDEGVGSAEGQGKSTQASWLISVQEKSTKLLKALPLQVKPLIGNKQSNNDPIYRFLLREVAVASKLLNKVRDDLNQLILMSKGESKSTNELRDIAKNIFNDSVPKVWQIYSTLELNVTEWILDLKNRINQLNKITQAKDYGRSGLWLGGLIFPEAYLTATRQSVAQELKVSLDELMLSVELVKNITSIDNTCFVLKGLCIEGAEWNYEQNKLIMTESLFSQLPPFLLKWSVKKNSNLSNIFPIPVYLNTMRKNLLFSVFIKNESILSDSDWYQRGIALISWNKTYEYESDNK